MSTKAPERPTAYQPEEPTPDTSDKKKSPWKRLIVGVTALAAIGGGVGYKVATSGENDPAPRAPEASAPVDPTPQTETTPTETAEPTPEADAEIKTTPLSAERFSTASELMRAHIPEYNNWMMSGTEDPDFLMEAMISEEPLIEKHNAPIDQAYIAARYVSDYQERPALKEIIDEEIFRHKAMVRAAAMTTQAISSDSLDTEPYRAQEELIDVNELSSTVNNGVAKEGDEIKLEYTVDISDNSDKNRAHTGTIINPVYTDGPKRETGHQTWIVEGGVWKIADISKPSLDQ